MNVIRNLFKGKRTAVCGKCGSKIDHFGFTLADFTEIESEDRETTVALMKSVGGKCPKCGKTCCAMCYHENMPNKYTCPNCGAKIPGFS